jgi:hypothetical protein
MYSINISGWSWPLLIFAFMAGFVGNMQYQSVFPFLTRYCELYTIAARSASDIFGIFISSLAFYQNPGSDKIRFSPFIFLLCIGLFLLVFPPLCLLYIYVTGEGLKNSDEDCESGKEINEESALLENIENKLKVPGFEVADDDASQHLWFYVSVVCWQDLNTWGLLSCFLPFVFYKNSQDMQEASVYLSYALNLQSLMIVLGGMSNYLFRIPVIVCVSLYSVCVTLLYISALGITWFYEKCWILVLLFCACNFLTSHTNTAIFNDLSSSKDEKIRIDGLKFVGLMTMIAIFIGTSFSLIISNYFFKCF